MLSVNLKPGARGPEKLKVPVDRQLQRLEC